MLLSLSSSKKYLASLLFIISACSSSKPKEDLPKELEQSSAKASTTPESVIFQEAKRQYEGGLYSVAKDRFESLRDSYPTGPYLEFALIKLADIEFDQGNYLAASQQYEDFIKTYPTSTSAAYVLLREARSLHLSNRGVGRDISPVQRSIEIYDKLLKDYPSTIYARAGREYRTEAVQRLADHEQFILDFYEKREQTEAASLREKQFKSEYSKLRDVPALPKQQSVKKNTYNSDTKIIMAERISDSSEKASTSFSTKFEKTSDGSPSIITASCKTDAGEKQIYIFLSKPIADSDFFQKFARVKSVDGRALFPLPGVVSKPITEDCFGEDDLIISSTGVVTIRNVRSAELLSLDNPPRLLFLPK